MTSAVVGAQRTLGARLAAELPASGLSYGSALPPGCTRLVVVVGADPMPRSTLLTTMTPQTWREQAEGVPRKAMRALQTAYTAMSSGGGRIVVITPTIGLVGAPSLVSYTTGIEAVRAMAKSAARQWASQRVNVNLVGVPLRLITAELADHAGHLTAAAHADADLIPSLIATVHFLLEAGAETLTGSTITVDGGAAMTP